MTNASVVEWSITTDCKSVAHRATQVRILPGAPMNEFCFLNGNILPVAEAKVGVLDIGILRGYGIYEGIAAVDGKILGFADHWSRFMSGAHLLDLNVPITEEVAEKKIKELLEKNDLKNRANIKMILTGGETVNSIEFNFESPTFYILVEKWEPLPLEYYEEGAKLLTYRHRRELPEYKTTNYLRAVNLQNWRKEEKAVEVLYTYDGEVLECATSNVFIVKDGVVSTPAENILKGVTRKIVMELSAQKYTTEERIIEEGELNGADEVFITSSFKDIVPIVKIDDFEVGDGRPGPITKDLMSKFASSLGAYLK